MDWVKENKVVVFSKSWDPYCTETKRLFDRYSLDYKTIELDNTPYGPDIHNALKRYCKHRTVPVIFIGGKYVGGNRTI